MGITRRPASRSADDFINSAPDAAATQSASPTVKAHRLTGKQVAISLALPPDLLSKVDVAARTLSISRAAFMKQAISRAVVEENS
jgi:hypothetical protein